MKSLPEKFALIFTKEPYRSFREHGITTGEDMLTSDGQIIFLSWMLMKHGEEFKKECVDKMKLDA